LPYLSLSGIAEQEIPLPPLPEQRRITHVLSTIQRAIAAQDALIAAARDLKRSLMRHLFTYGPVPPDQADQAPSKETEIGPMPKDWEVVRLGEVAIAKYGKAKPETAGDVPVVGSGGTYYWTDQVLVDYPTLVIGRKGTAGRAWLLERSFPPLDEQHEIASALSTVDRKIEAEEQRKAAMEALFKTMLHQLMTGQIKVRVLPKE